MENDDNLKTVLANERTFAAWIRTGLAFLAAGIAAANFLKEGWYASLVPWIASVLILFAGLSFAFSTWHFYKLDMRLMSKKQRGAPHMLLFFLSFFLVLVSILTLFIIWIV